MIILVTLIAMLGLIHCAVCYGSAWKQKDREKWAVILAIWAIIVAVMIGIVVFYDSETKEVSHKQKIERMIFD